MVDKRIELCENVVSTDYIEGNTLHYFTYATEWTDKEHVIKFDTVEKAIDWYYWHFRGRLQYRVSSGRARTAKKIFQMVTPSQHGEPL